MSEPPVAAPVTRTSALQSFLDEAHSNAYKNAADSLARCGQLIQNTSARIAADRQLLDLLEEVHEKLAAVVLSRLKGPSHFLLLLFLYLTQNIYLDVPEVTTPFTTTGSPTGMSQDRD